MNLTPPSLFRRAAAGCAGLLFTSLLAAPASGAALSAQVVASSGQFVTGSTGTVKDFVHIGMNNAGNVSFVALTNVGAQVLMSNGAGSVGSFPVTVQASGAATGIASFDLVGLRNDGRVACATTQTNGSNSFFVNGVLLVNTNSSFRGFNAAMTPTSTVLQLMNTGLVADVYVHTLTGNDDALRLPVRVQIDGSGTTYPFTMGRGIVSGYGTVAGTAGTCRAERSVFFGTRNGTMQTHFSCATPLNGKNPALSTVDAVTVSDQQVLTFSNNVLARRTITSAGSWLPVAQVNSVLNGQPLISFYNVAVCGSSNVVFSALTGNGANQKTTLVRANASGITTVLVRPGTAETALPAGSTITEIRKWTYNNNAEVLAHVIFTQPGVTATQEALIVYDTTTRLVGRTGDTIAVGGVAKTITGFDIQNTWTNMVSTGQRPLPGNRKVAALVKVGNDRHACVISY